MSPSTTQAPTTRRTLLALGLGSLLLGASASTVIADDEKETSTEKVEAKIDRTALRSLSKANQEFAYDFYRQGIAVRKACKLDLALRTFWKILQNG